MAAPTLNPVAAVALKQRHARFVPAVGGMLVVQLPGESMRCPVQRVVDEDTAIVKLDTPPMAKSHSFRFDDVVGVRRRTRDGRDYWEAQSDRDFLAEQQRLTAPHSPRKKGRTA